MSRTLVAALADWAARTPDAPYVCCAEGGSVISTLSYAETWLWACRWATMFRQRGLRRGEAVLLAVPNTADYVGAYFGTLLAGGVPASMHGLRGRKPPGAQIQLVVTRLRVLGARFLVLPEEQAQVSSDPCLEQIHALQPATAGDLPACADQFDPPCAEEELALFQFTSGTSGRSKAVELTHGALYAQTSAVSAALQLDPSRDSALTWLPLCHDMGLIGFLLTPIIVGGRVTLMRTEEFMLHPSLWMKAVSRTGATITGGPPSAYVFCARSSSDSEVASWDLRHLRIALVGAEQVTRVSMERFAQRFAPSGFCASSLMPCYGLAENSLAATITPLGEGVRTEVVSRWKLQEEGVADATSAASHNGSPAREIVSVGRCLANTEMRIVSRDGDPLPEHYIGEIILRSPSLMRGYYNDATASADTLRQGWLYTGDFGYMSRGYLYITGRKKDLIIVGGRNYHPEDLEELVHHTAGQQASRAVAISVFDPEKATESVVVLLEISSRSVEREPLRQRVRESLLQAAYPINDVVLLPPRSLSTTPNGKLQRLECRTRYLAHEYENGW